MSEVSSASTSNPPPGRPVHDSPAHDSSLRGSPGRALPVGWLYGLLVLTLATFLGSAVRADFLNFDDDRFFGRGIDRPAAERAELGSLPMDGNGSELAAAVRESGLVGLLDPSRTVVDAYLPVAHLSLELDRRLFGDEPLGAHLHSLVLHLGAVAMLYALLFRVLRSGPRAALGAALFAVHPAVAESVLWVSGRKDLLSGLFVFTALWTLVGAVQAAPRRAGLRPILMVGLWSLLAIFSKGTAVVLGPIAVLGALALGARGRGLLPALAALAVTLLGATLHFVIAQEQATLVSRPMSETLLQVPGALWHYLQTAVLPTDLDVLYPERSTFAGFVDRVTWSLIGWAVFAGLTVFAWRRGAGRTAFGMVAFVLALAPFNTALPATSIAAADRYLYLALPALGLAVVALPRLPVWVLPLALIPLMVAGFLRARDFENSERLWTASLERDPQNLAAAVNLSNYRISRLLFAGIAPESIRDRIGPDLASAWSEEAYPQHRARAANLRATLAERAGQFAEASDQAVAVAEAMAELAGGDRADAIRFDARIQAARLARQAGDDEAMATQLAAAEELQPDSPLLACYRVSLWLRELQADAQKGLPIDPEVLTRCGAALDRAEQAFAEAEERSGDAQAVAIGRADLHWNRGEIARLQQRWTKAALEYERAVQADPGRAEPHLALGALYLSQPDFADQAVAAIRRAIAYGVDDPALRYQLALALGQKGDLEDARRHFEFYLRREPGDRDAERSLARILLAQGLRDLEKLDPQELLRQALRIQKLDASLPGALKMRGVAAMKMREFDEAVAFFDRLLEVDPNDPEVPRYRAETLRNKGYALQLAGRRDESIEAFRRFLESAPLDLDTRAARSIVDGADRRAAEARGNAALDEGGFEEAEKAFERCLALDPDRVEVRMQLGLARFGIGDERLVEALEDFRAVEAWARRQGLDPSLAIYYQIRSLVRLDRWQEALDLADAYLADPPAEAEEAQLDRIRQLVR